MKQIAMIAAVSAILAGCVSVQAVQKQTPAEIAAQVCPNLEAAKEAIDATPGVLDAETQAKLDKAAPIIAKVCAASLSPSKPDLQSLSADAVPLLQAAVTAAPIDPAQKLAINFGITTAKNLIAQQLAEEATEASAAK